MTLSEALKLNIPLRRPNKMMITRASDTSYSFLTNRHYITPNTWIDAEMLMYNISLDRDDFVADDWEVKWPEGYELKMETCE